MKPKKEEENCERFQDGTWTYITYIIDWLEKKWDWETAGKGNKIVTYSPRVSQKGNVKWEKGKEEENFVHELMACVSHHTCLPTFLGGL